MVQQEQQDDGDAEPADDTDVDDGGFGGPADDGDEGGAVILPARSVDATIYFNRVEYTVGEVRVVDEDHEAGTLPDRGRGLSVEIDVEAFNPHDSQVGINALTPTLSWTDPESGLVHQAFGSAVAGVGVPGGGRANLSLEYQVEPLLVELFDLDQTTLRFGNEGQHAPTVPFGVAGELADKFFHHQELLVGQSIEIRDQTWTIDEAFVGYTHGNGRLDDDQVLLEIAYTWRNNSDAQQCHYRGEGRNFELLHTGTGIGALDLGTERCVRAGDSQQYRTGFLLPADEFTGTWTLTINHDYQGGGSEDLSGSLDVDVIDNPLSVSEWP